MILLRVVKLVNDTTSNIITINHVTLFRFTVLKQKSAKMDNASASTIARMLFAIQENSVFKVSALSNPDIVQLPPNVLPASTVTYLNSSAKKSKIPVVTLPACQTRNVSTEPAISFAI